MLSFYFYKRNVNKGHYDYFNKGIILMTTSG